jgi:hypothetical protein
MLTPVMARMSRAIQARTGKWTAYVCSDIIRENNNKLDMQSNTYLPPFQHITIETWISAVKKNLDLYYSPCKRRCNNLDGVHKAEGAAV